MPAANITNGLNVADLSKFETSTTTGILKLIDGEKQYDGSSTTYSACWGNNEHGQAPPDGIDGDFVAIAAGAVHSLALGSDGSVACWGDNTYDQAPPDGLDGDFVEIAAGNVHSLALRRDGSIACWGYNYSGQAPPEGVVGPFFTHDRLTVTN